MDFKTLPTTKENLIRLNSKKHIYYIQERPNIIVKIIPTKTLSDVKNIEQEIRIQRQAYNIGHEYRIPIFVPEIYEFFVYDEVYYILMERLEGVPLANVYGEDYDDLPEDIKKEVHHILKMLFLNDIHYVDVTPYNFLLCDERIYLVDFGHASIVPVNYYLKEFLVNRMNSWNTDFL